MRHYGRSWRPEHLGRHVLRVSGLAGRAGRKGVRAGRHEHLTPRAPGPALCNGGQPSVALAARAPDAPSTWAGSSLRRAIAAISGYAKGPTHRNCTKAPASVAIPRLRQSFRSVAIPASVAISSDDTVVLITVGHWRINRPY